jgi:hypothetical protein
LFLSFNHLGKQRGCGAANQGDDEDPEREETTAPIGKALSPALAISATHAFDFTTQRGRRRREDRQLKTERRDQKLLYFNKKFLNKKILLSSGTTHWDQHIY